MRWSPARVLLVAALLASVGVMLVAPGAIAADGEGLYGRTTDKVITFFAFGVIGFFAVLVTVLSLVQIRREGRKERLQRDLQRFGR